MFRGSLSCKHFICAGCGPSLKDIDYSKVPEEATFIATNNSGLFLANTKTENEILQIITDPKRIIEGKFIHPEDATTIFAPCEINADVIDSIYERDYQFDSLFIDSGPQPWRKEGNVPFDTYVRHWNERPRFDIPRFGMQHFGQSVIFAAIQLAYFFGAMEITLIGTDMDYYGQGKQNWDPDVRHLNPGWTFEEFGRDQLWSCRKILSDRGVFLSYVGNGNVSTVLPTQGHF